MSILVSILILVGRILFALNFFMNGVFGHLRQRKMMAGYASSKGLAAASFFVPASGVLLVVGSLMVGFGVWADLGALLLLIFLVPTAFIMHGYWRESDPTAKSMEQSQFFKDISLAGAALALFAAFVSFGPTLGLVFVGPLFHF